MFYVICFIINYEMFARNCYQTRTKVKHKERFKIWKQRKGEAQQYNSEHFQNSANGCRDIFVFKNLDNTFSVLLQ